jgi:hypothetical protein
MANATNSESTSDLSIRRKEEKSPGRVHQSGALKRAGASKAEVHLSVRLDLLSGAQNSSFSGPVPVRQLDVNVFSSPSQTEPVTPPLIEWVSTYNHLAEQNRYMPTYRSHERLLADEPGPFELVLIGEV